jgi:hypothetical protein
MLWKLNITDSLCSGEQESSLVTDSSLSSLDWVRRQYLYLLCLYRHVPSELQTKQTSVPRFPIIQRIKVGQSHVPNMFHSLPFSVPLLSLFSWPYHTCSGFEAQKLKLYITLSFVYCNSSFVSLWLYRMHLHPWGVEQSFALTIGSCKRCILG